MDVLMILWSFQDSDALEFHAGSSKGRGLLITLLMLSGAFWGILSWSLYSLIGNYCRQRVIPVAQKINNLPLF